MWKLKILSKTIEIWLLWNWFEKETWNSERWRHCDVKSSMFGVVLLWLWVQWPWLADCSVWNGTLLSIVQINSVLMRNTKALGFVWPSFCLVMFHIIPAEHSKANEVQQGHNFFKVFSLSHWQKQKRVWASDLKARDAPQKESDFSVKIGRGRENRLESVSEIDFRSL